MRILVATSTFPAHLDDGTPRFVLDLARSLAAHAEVTVLAPDSPGADLQGRWGDVTIHRFRYFWPRSWQCLTPCNGSGMRENFRDSWLARLQLPWFLAHQTANIRRLVRQQKIDVVNAHWIIPQGYTAVRALRGMDWVRLVLHIHAGDVYLLRRLPLGRRIAQQVVRRAQTIFADGSHVRDTLNELVGWDVGARLQPMGVHCAQFREFDPAATQDDFRDRFPAGYILFVGRLVQKKGAIFLIQAMQHVARRFPDLGLVLIGRGPLRPELEREVQRLGLVDRVQFAGAKPHPAVVHSMHAARVVAVPSIIDDSGETEGMPTVVTEALATGAKVVASAVAGIPDVIRDGENGWLCREQDADDLANKLIEALLVPDDSPVIEAAFKTAENYDWRQVAQNYWKCVSGLLSAPLVAS